MYRFRYDVSEFTRSVCYSCAHSVLRIVPFQLLASAASRWESSGILWCCSRSTNECTNVVVALIDWMCGNWKVWNCFCKMISTKRTHATRMHYDAMHYPIHFKRNLNKWMRAQPLSSNVIDAKAETPSRDTFIYFPFTSEKFNFPAHNGNAQFDFPCIHRRHGSFCAKQRVTLFVLSRISRWPVGWGGTRAHTLNGKTSNNIRRYACTIVDNATTDFKCIYYSIFEHNTLISELGGCSACVRRCYVLLTVRALFCFVSWDAVLWVEMHWAHAMPLVIYHTCTFPTKLIVLTEEGWPMLVRARAAYRKPKTNTPSDDRWKRHECQTTDDMKKQESVHEQSSRIRNGIFCDLWHSDVPTPYSIIHVIRFHKQTIQKDLMSWVVRTDKHSEMK